MEGGGLRGQAGPPLARALRARLRHRRGEQHLLPAATEVKPFQAQVFTAPWTFVRFHYGSRGRRGNYSESELGEWAWRFEEWRREVEVFAYFNNDWEVFAVRNALWMKRRLA